VTWFSVWHNGVKEPVRSKRGLIEVRARYGGYRGFNMTPIWVLLAVNFLFFIATLIREELILTTFGFTPSQFLDEPWTIVTNLFVHAGLWHILANMLMLYFFGSYLLGLLGEVRFLIVYFAGGLLGNLLFFLLGNEYAIVVGASGALLAVMGAMAVMRPRLKVLIWFLFPVDLWILVVVIGALIIPTQMESSNIAWQAHIGGLVLGLASGLYFRKKERGRFWG
jgi:membrane associated rhomboid family serine protease